MNPDDAYRAQTDWARAVRDPSSNHGAWFGQRMHELLSAPGGDPEQGLYRRLGSPDSFEMLRASGPGVESSMIMGYEPNRRDPGELPTDVYDIDSDMKVDPAFARPEQMLVPSELYREITLDALSAAPTYYVTRDMVTVMEAAAAGFDDSDTMPRMPRGSGFVVLARPIMLPMPSGAQPVHAFAWNTWGEINTTSTLTGRGVVGELWTFASRRRDSGFRMVADARGAWSSKKAWSDDPDLLPSFCDWLLTGAPIPPTSEQAAITNARARAHRWFIENTRVGDPTRPPSDAAWTGSLTAAEAREDQFLAEELEKDPESRYGYFQPYLAAFVLLLTQQITLAAKQPATPSAARLAGKVSHARPSDVTVVDIRPRRRSGDGVATGAKCGPVTVHHLVEGHWKWQPYGPKSGMRRRIYLATYDRGPEDQPLVVKPRVTRLS